MEQVTLTSAHWVFLLVILVIFTFMIFRRDVVLPAILGTFVLGFIYNLELSFLNGLVAASQVVFGAFLNSGIVLFDIMLVIALMVAMLKSLQNTGADTLMVSPLKRLMVNPTTAFFVLGSAMYLAATFFWPTPAVALVGTVLLPVALKAGLPAMGAAISINLFGHGMALSGDLVIQGATGITSSAAGLQSVDILPYTALFSFVVGFIAIGIAYYRLRRGMAKGKWKATPPEDALSIGEDDPHVEQNKKAKFLAMFVPFVLFSVVFLMLYRAFITPEYAIQGDEATALLGGTAVSLLLISSFLSKGNKAIEDIVGHIREGFYFAIKIFAPVIPIAAFFLLGHPDHAETVLGEGAPGFLFDLGTAMAHHIDSNPVTIVVGMVIISLLAGMDGSGFSGLPLVGALAAGLGGGAGMDVAVLASIGQVATIFAGGGTLAAWAFGVAADSGVAGVKPMDLVRQNFLPVMIGLLVATIIAILII
ncbi:hypothetical protein [Evansella cellulosilytica]|uniref:Citrate transporter n=1 Tax=Evansella cellulosilytica (strain ATCC 21833 / DSM 2522 / FERM P-1141 / JCM 9156 / N-4) TaxID=649639 RepID=E6U1A9_EVAC2|nr:hypothetical protein [Evansella cellulosilytica]ADU29156.1 hypothetical protein Bcell_0880 [Evansella cellulosilytica DSM 2522]